MYARTWCIVMLTRCLGRLSEARAVYSLYLADTINILALPSPTSMMYGGAGLRYGTCVAFGRNFRNYHTHKSLRDAVCGQSTHQGPSSHRTTIVYRSPRPNLLDRLSVHQLPRHGHFLVMCPRVFGRRWIGEGKVHLWCPFVWWK